MNAVVRVFLSSFLVLTFNISLLAQRQAPAPPPPQSPRQALIEMVSGGNNAVLKHLTVEVQQLLQQSEFQEARLALTGANSLKDDLGGNLQIFETGEVLLAWTNPVDHSKYEIHVNNDDLSGDTDTLELSLHTLVDGQEVKQEWQSFLSHFTITMLRQQEIWRLNKVSATADFAIGDPEFLKALYRKSAPRGAAGVGVVGGGIGPGVHAELRSGEPGQVVEFQPTQLITMLGYAEQAYARQHVDVGFTCSLSELVEKSKTFGLDPQVSSGLYKGYKISLTGCQGRPSGSFQITAEPIAKGGRAYCTDATQNLRVSDDGRASTCLLAGRSEHAAVPDEDESVGVDPSSAPAPAKPKDPQ